jgi:hypothetical protein
MILYIYKENKLKREKEFKLKGNIKGFVYNS